MAKEAALGASQPLRTPYCYCIRTRAVNFNLEQKVAIGYDWLLLGNYWELLENYLVNPVDIQNLLWEEAWWEQTAVIAAK